MKTKINALPGPAVPKADILCDRAGTSTYAKEYVESNDMR